MTQPAVPTHHRIAERIARMGRSRGGLSHSLLVHGPVGAGQREVAIRFCQSVFCETGDGPFGACGTCRSCRRIPLGEHPDLIWIEPQLNDKDEPNAFKPRRDRSHKTSEKSSEKRGLRYISIKTIRALEDRLVQEPFEGPRVVGCIFEADKLQVDAANTLLKLVEEPPSHALILFATEFRLKILPTIRSRCLSVPLGYPNPQTLEAYFMEEFDLAPEQAREAVQMASDADIEPAQALNESIQKLRRDSLALFDLAVMEGEHKFIPTIRNLKLDRESFCMIIRFWRDILRECVLCRDKGGLRLGFQAETPRLEAWSRRLNGPDCADLMDLSFEHEEAIQGFARPELALAAFLSEVRQRATSEN